jgi:uracil-DNA glycosylase family 4
LGFFLTQEEVAQQSKASQLAGRGKAAARPRVSKRLVQSGERGCDACELKETWKRIVSPRMPVSGNNEDADILVLGEGPGEEEDNKGQIFIGPTGTLLRRYLGARFTDRLAFQNAVRCRPSDDNRTPTAHEMYCCSIHLDDDIARLPIKAILGVGGAPLSRWIHGGRANITSIHGTKFPIKVGEKVLWYYPVFHPSFVMRLRGDKGGEGPAMPVFQADLKRFFAEVDSWPKPQIYDLAPSMVIAANSQAQVYQILDKMRGIIALDVETTCPIKGAVPKPYMIGAKIITAAISDGNHTVAWSVDDNDWGLDTLLTIAEDCDWVAHSASYELGWLLWLSRKHNRKKPIARFGDTMTLARLYHRREKLLSLSIVSRIHLGVDVKQILDINTEKLTVYTRPEILQYNGLDSLATILCYHKMIDEVNQQHYNHLLERVKSTVEMELIGLPVSVKESRAISAKWSAKAIEAEAAVKRIYEVREYERVYGEFNIGTPENVGRALVEFGKVALPKTPKGKQHQTDDEALNNAAPDHPLVKGVLDWREATKIKSTYTEVVQSAAERYIDGLIHPSYTTVHTATLRTSSNEPNAQNWPSRKHREVRKQVVAPEGHVWVAMDYGQIQVRILGMVSDDRRLAANLLDPDFDTHIYWLNKALDAYPIYLDRLADKTGETSEANIRKYGRNIIKTDFVFNSFFGGGANSISQRTGIPLKITLDLQRDFWSEFRGVRKWIEMRRYEYKETGSIRTPSGYVRHGLLMKNEPINTPIQAGEAEIVLAAQNALSRKAFREEDMYWHPRINIHDDLGFILPDDDRLPGYIEMIAAIMLKVRYPWQTLPLTVECKIGPNWGDLEEVAVFTGDYIR